MTIGISLNLVAPMTYILVVKVRSHVNEYINLGVPGTLYY